jgi:hypothetical protein
MWNVECGMWNVDCTAKIENEAEGDEQQNANARTDAGWWIGSTMLLIILGLAI